MAMGETTRSAVTTSRIFNPSTTEQEKLVCRLLHSSKLPPTSAKAALNDTVPSYSKFSTRWKQRPPPAARTVAACVGMLWRYGGAQPPSARLVHTWERS